MKGKIFWLWVVVVLGLSALAGMVAVCIAEWIFKTEVGLLGWLPSVLAVSSLVIFVVIALRGGFNK